MTALETTSTSTRSDDGMFSVDEAQLAALAFLGPV